MPSRSDFVHRPLPCSLVNEFNLRLFQFFSATDPTATSIAVARFFAEELIWAVPLSLTCAWLWGDAKLKRAALEAALAGGLALAVAQVFALTWYHPRPFAAGFGPSLVEHVDDSSFPSDHLTLLGAVAVGLLLRRESLLIGVLLAVLSLPVAWARVYLRVHFPFDIVGGLTLGAAAAFALLVVGQPVVTLVFPLATRVYAFVFGPMIRRGWVRP